MTYRTLLEQAQKYCDKADSEYLLQGITNKKVYELYLDNSTVPQDTIDKFTNLLQQKRPDMPIQYLLHKAYFMSYELYVDERVMIPRFETEELVIKTATKLNALGLKPKAILDIGTGSSAIAIAMAELFPNAKLVATDISIDALEVAKININNYNMSNRIALSHNDLFPSFASNKFDLIISNPPYIPNDEIENLPLSVKHFEPPIALNGGKHGFELIERIIKQAADYLEPNGLLALEIDPQQEMLINDLVCGNDFPVAIAMLQFESDNQGLIRYVFLRYK